MVSVGEDLSAMGQSATGRSSQLTYPRGPALSPRSKARHVSKASTLKALFDTHTTLRALWAWSAYRLISLEMIAMVCGSQQTHSCSPKFLTHRRGSLFGENLVPCGTDTSLARVLCLKKSDVKSGSTVEKANVGDVETGHACGSMGKG